MRTLLAAGLAALTFAIPLGAQSAADLVGSWTFDQETPRGTVTHDLTFTTNDDGWVGTMSTERCSFDLENVAFEDGRLTFSFEAGPASGRGCQAAQCPGGPCRRASGAEPLPARSFEGVLDGDEIRGEMDLPRGQVAVVLRRAAG